MSLHETGDHGNNDIDRGWALVVLGAVLSGAVICTCAYFAHGVLYVVILERFSDREAKTALISGICFAILSFGAPLGGTIINRISCRFCIMIGGALSAIGFFSNAFMSNVDELLATLGVCTGFGLAFYNSGLVCILGLYFKRYRSTVSASYFLVIEVAMFGVTPLCIYLVETYGLSMSFSILGCIQAQICIIGALCKPSSLEKALYIERRRNVVGESNKLLGKSGLNWSVLCRKSYLLFLLYVSCWDFQLDSVAVHLPNYINTAGGKDTDISYTMMIFAAANALGRVTGVILISYFYSKCLHAQCLRLLVSGVFTTFFWSYSHAVGGAYMFAVQAGFFTGIPNAMIMALSLKFIGATKVSEAYAFIYVACGIGMAGGPVIIGYIYGETKSYGTSFMVSGIVALFGL